MLQLHVAPDTCTHRYCTYGDDSYIFDGIKHTSGVCDTCHLPVCKWEHVAHSPVDTIREEDAYIANQASPKQHKQLSNRQRDSKGRWQINALSDIAEHFAALDA